MPQEIHGAGAEAEAEADRKAFEAPAKVYLLGKTLQIRDETNGNIITPRTDDVLKSLNVRSWTVFTDRDAAINEQQSSSSTSKVEGEEFAISQRTLFTIIPKEFGNDMIIEQVKSYSIPGIGVKEKIHLNRKDPAFTLAGLQNLLIQTSLLETGPKDEISNENDQIDTTNQAIKYGALFMFVYFLFGLYASIAQNEMSHPDKPY